MSSALPLMRMRSAQASAFLSLDADHWSAAASSARPPMVRWVDEHAGATRPARRLLPCQRPCAGYDLPPGRRAREASTLPSNLTPSRRREVTKRPQTPMTGQVAHRPQPMTIVSPAGYMAEVIILLVPRGLLGYGITGVEPDHPRTVD